MILFLPWNERKSKNERIKEWKRIRKRKGYVNLVHLPKKRETHLNVYKWSLASFEPEISKLYRWISLLWKRFDWSCRPSKELLWAQWERRVSSMIRTSNFRSMVGRFPLPLWCRRQWIKFCFQDGELISYLFNIDR